MSDFPARSEDFVEPEKVRFVVRSDNDKRPDRMMTSQGVEDLETALKAARNALTNGAAEVRIRPYP